MHWTAFLAYRRFPAHARVADDLACAGCGYNLRSALANGQCPECGRAVGDSLYVLNRPEVVGKSLRTIGKTYLGIVVLLLACIVPTLSGWPAIVAMGVLCFIGLIRAVAAAELRYRGAIDTLPIIGTRVRLLWFVGLADVALAALACGVLWINAKNWFSAAWVQSVETTLLTFWLIAHVLGAFLAGWLGTALATMLWYTFARWEFILQRIGLALWLACTGMALVAGWGGAGRGGNLALALSVMLAYVCLALSMFALAAGLTHLGNGAEGETDTWDDVLDTNPHGTYSRPGDSQAPEQPPIALQSRRPER